jgi:cytochrome c biogenesis protein CcdA/thiol-disulfide isomerase/thioredoxin
MTLLILSYLGGILTILSPCVLPVLPFVFARAGRPFTTSILPMLIGMALTFAAVATLAAVGGGWVIRANDYGRLAAMVLLAVFGLMLLLPHLADRLTQPLVAFGNRISQPAAPGEPGRGSIIGSVVLGIAVGFLWAPCAGPILGLILTGAALQGPNAQTSLLLLAYALGAATSLALALLVGGKVFAFLKKSLGTGEWIRRGLGVLVLAAVAAIAMGLDTGLLTRVSLAGTSDIEQSLLNKAGAGHPTNAMSANSAMMSANNAMTGAPHGDAMTGAMTGAANGGAMTGAMTGAAHGDAMTGAANGGAMTGAMTGAASGGAMSGTMNGGAMMSSAHGNGGALPIEGELPPLSGAVSWINTPPLTPESLKGKVVLVDFWTYSCINCLRTLPYIRGWAAKYKAAGLVVLGIHTPEFAFEKNIDNVKRAVKDLGITYPVAVDNNYALWGAFFNNYWPADYFVDAQGHIRGHAFGEGDYDKSERLIQTLLKEAGKSDIPAGLVNAQGKGIEAAPSDNEVKSSETYVGYERAQSFANAGGEVKDQTNNYTAPTKLQLNQWGLGGSWTVEGEKAVLGKAPGSIVFRFHARDLHLVLGPAPSGSPVRFKVLIDGKPPGADHGVDVDAQGAGTVSSQRLYQLIRQSGAVQDRTFTIEFQDPGVQAFSFTFG